METNIKKNSVVNENLSHIHLRFFRAFIDNPHCQRLKELPKKEFERVLDWNPADSFFRWAAHPKRLNAALKEYFSHDNLIYMDATGSIPTQEGEFSLNVPLNLHNLELQAQGMVHHKGKNKIIGFCCQPDREGKTSRYSLQKERYRAALLSYAYNNKNPSQTFFLVLHQWDQIRIHHISIAYELNHIHSILSQPPSSQSYNYQERCRWFCPKHEQCHQQAQIEGVPDAWSAPLRSLSKGYNIWELRDILASDSQIPERFRHLAQIYTRAKEEKE